MKSRLPPFPRLGEQTPDVDARLDLRAALVPLLNVFLSSRPGEFSTLCEVGCGSGRLLRECAERMPMLSRYVGLHASPVQTLINRTLYRELPLRFESIDVLDWLATHAVPGSIYLTDAEQLAGNDAWRHAVLQAWRHSHRPTVLAIAIPLPGLPGSNAASPLFAEINRIAFQVPYSIEMPVAATSACRLVVAEF